MYSSNLRIRKSITEDAALMSFAFNSSLLRFLAMTVFVACMATAGMSQTEAALTDDPDPVRLFERGQAAHARGDFTRALELYEEAIKVRPEFPEAEFQRGAVLVSLNRLTDAEPAFRRAIELRKNWSLPYTSLGVLLTRTDRGKARPPRSRTRWSRARSSSARRRGGCSVASSPTGPTGPTGPGSVAT